LLQEDALIFNLVSKSNIEDAMTAFSKDQLMFSIIIPTYNYADTLSRAIDSILDQSGSDYEILIIDDGSTDHTPKIADGFCQKFPKKIKYYLQDNQGPASARNYGVKLSVGEYIFFLDADDEMAPNLLDILRKRISYGAGANVFFGDHISVNSDGIATYRATRPLPQSYEKRFSAYIFKKLQLSHCAKLLHRRVFERVSYPIDLRSSEDVPFMAQLLALYECELIGVPMAIVYKHADSLRHNTDYIIESESRVVDHIFSFAALPDWAAKYKEIYRARRCLSIFRTLYLSDQKKEALVFYKRALFLSPFLALRPGYIKKAIGGWFCS